MRTLILGCGYLGKRVASAWIEAGHVVFALTRSQQNAETFRRAGIEPLLGDVCDAASLADLPNVDIVLHSVGFDQNSGRSRDEAICGGMRNVLNAVSGRCCRFIQISSTSVYGQSAGEWVDECSNCEPAQPGGQLALAAERLVREQFPEVIAPRAVVLRLAGIYGPGRLLSRIDSLQAGLPILGRGDSWLNLIHVDDAVTAILKCTTLDISATTFNVVDDQPIERRAYFELLARLVGAPVPTFDPTQPTNRGSGGLNKRCSNRKLRDEINWNPAYSSIAVGLPASIGASSIQ